MMRNAPTYFSETMHFPNIACASCYHNAWCGWVVYMNLHLAARHILHDQPTSLLEGWPIGVI